MSKLKKIPGYKKDHITVVERLPENKLLVRCDCGNEYTIFSSNLSKVHSCKSCAALKITKHGKANTPLYHMWEHMKQRCENKKTKHFDRYGGRGISVCDEWKDSSNFIKWALENGYKEGLDIDRTDNNGNYTPENCRFVDKRTQQNNRNNTIFITAFGETLPCAEWARRTGIAKNTIRGRIVMGWSPEDAVSAPVSYKSRRNR